MLPAYSICNQTLPEFLRLPRVRERCPITGMSRASMNQLILGPDAPVRSICVIRPGGKRGIRLVETRSLLEYLQHFAKEGGK